MKRLIVLAMATLIVGQAFAQQGTFTIRRPVDGASVREGVKIRIPKNSIPEYGYIGVYVNGKFVEATLPEIDGDDYVYTLDTQGRELPDGPTKVECVLYVDVNGRPQIVNRTSVNLNIDNKTSIKIPEDGIKLRYKFQSGTENVYGLVLNQEVGMVSQAQAQLGSRAPMISSDDVRVRLLYATDNVYSGNTGRDSLLRIQLLPDKGKSYATIIPTGETTTKKITRDQMAPMYMRISDVGRESFGSVPLYFGLDGQNGAIPETQYYPLIPLPVLPTKAIKPGEQWQSTFQLPNVDADKMHDVNSFTTNIPARGEFVGVMWYRGMKCAKIKMTMSVGKELLKNVKNLNQVKGQANNLSLDETYYFALDRGVIVRNELSVTQESLIDVGTSAAGNSGGSGGGDVSKKGPIGAGDAPGLGAGMKTDLGGMRFEFRPQWDEKGNLTLFQNRGGKGGNKGGAGDIGGLGMGGDGQDEGSARGNQNGGGRFGQRGGGGNSGPRKMVMRFKMTYLAELEQ